MIFPWRHQKIYEGSRIDLAVDFRDSGRTGTYRSVNYRILLHGHATKIGTCDLRIGKPGNEELYYAGEAGYRIDEPWRGHGYAYDACRMMIRIMKKEYGRNTMILTCSPDNSASRKTIEKLGAEWIEETNVPPWHWLYRRGEKVKEIYRVNF